MVNKSLKQKLTIAIILLILFAIVIFVAILFERRMNGLDNLPQGNLICTSHSPTGEYTVNAYSCGGNATTDFSVRCEVVYNATGDKRNIYWEYRKESVELMWLDEQTIQIDQTALNVNRDSYDWRRQ